MCNQKILPDTSEVLIYRKNLRPKIPTWQRNLRTKKRNNAFFFYVFLNFFFIFLFFCGFLDRVLMDGRVGIYQQYKNSCRLSLSKCQLRTSCAIFPPISGNMGFSTWMIELRQLPLKKKTSATSRIETSEIRDSTLEALPPFLSPLVGGKYFGEESWQRPGNTLHTFSKANVRKTLQKLSKRHPSHRHISQGNAKVWAPKIAKEKQIAGPWTTFILLQDAVVPSGNHYFHQQKQSMRLGTSL